MGNAKLRISSTQFFLMLSLALIYDGLQILFDVMIIGVVLSFFIDLWAYLTFFTWFLILGVSMIRPANMMTLYGGILVELIPIVSALPAWTGIVIFTKAITDAEDLAGMISPELQKILQLGQRNTQGKNQEKFKEWGKKAQGQSTGEENNQNQEKFKEGRKAQGNSVGGRKAQGQPTGGEKAQGNSVGGKK